MEILLHKTNRDFQFIAENQNAVVDICASPELAPYARGFRPTELLLAGLAGCLSIDIQNILTKQRMPLDAISIRVSAEREEEIPYIFKSISVEIKTNEEVNKQKLQKAIKLAVDKYCTVYKILSATSDISISFNHM